METTEIVETTESVGTTEIVETGGREVDPRAEEGGAAKKFFCYWVVSGSRSYIGATVDPRKRLRQHCGVLTGGARRTRGRLWKFQAVLSGFRTWKEALQFEWSFKFHSKRCRSIASRRGALESVLARERWTSNAPLASSVPLVVEWEPDRYGLPPEGGANRGGGATRGGSPKKRHTRPFKKTLHGVSY